MSLKFIQRLLLPRQFGIRHASIVSTSSVRLLGDGSKDWRSCLACLCTSAGCCIRRLSCRKLQNQFGRMGLTTLVREPFSVTASSVGLHRDSIPRFRLTHMYQPIDVEEQTFQQRLGSCYSSQQVIKVLSSLEVMSDSMAAAVLHRVADLEQEAASLKDPTVLEHDTLRALCFQLEQDSGQLTDAALVSILLACTRLCTDSGTKLMMRLRSESQERLDGGQMTVGHLCVLGQALLAVKGPGCVMFGQVMEQIQKQEPAQWTIADLTALYRLVQSGVGEERRYWDLLNAMHAHAMSVTNQMDAPAVSGLLDALVTLNQNQAIPLIISLCKQAVRHVPYFTHEEFTNVLGALMHFGHSDQYFVKALEMYFPKVVFTSHPETITKVMQFFGWRNVLSRPVFDTVAECFVYRADDYSLSQVAGQIIAFGKLGYLPPNSKAVFRKLETILQTHFSHLKPRTLISLLHSCILVERFPVNFVPSVFSSYFLQQLEEETAIDSVILAQLTQLYLTMKLECPFYKGRRLLPRYQVKSFLTSGVSLETPVDMHLYHSVTNGLVNLLGTRSYFASNVLTHYCYTLDVEIKLDEGLYVLPAHENDEVHKRIALCIDGQKRFTTGTRQLLGAEATKQRHLRLLGYEVVQIPYYEFETLQNDKSVMDYLHKKIFPHSFRLSW
ncbi:FAST kinase domain-containing protein 3, mitochondrial isoform X2 [Thalassophryne amazonica]|uniref:FAST kinase domain-containing protein 3, mitochondrial isoform X2 n=1 Tax=Thalassophryne amazonica TaxID=390379 RepID=UPI0014716A90|nr:FAST kinase domain-containing protein 3, mitochondrial isoform X2 [Thalassophryne amazonica]